MLMPAVKRIRPTEARAAAVDLIMESKESPHVRP